jgi:hypothetical protein
VALGGCAGGAKALDVLAKEWLGGGGKESAELLSVLVGELGRAFVKELGELTNDMEFA